MGKYDWGEVAGDTVSGATTGFSFGGPVGAGIGGLAGFAKGLFTRKKKKKKKISTLDKNQQKINDEQYAGLHGEGPFGDLYDYDPEKANDVFDKNTASKAYRDWKEKTMPAITGNFRSEGLANSSYVGDALAKSGRDVQESLDAKRAKYLYNQENNAKGAKRQALENFQNRTTFDYEKQSPQQGSGGNWMDSIVKQFGPAAADSIQDFAVKFLPGGV